MNKKLECSAWLGLALALGLSACKPPSSADAPAAPAPAASTTAAAVDDDQDPPLPIVAGLVTVKERYSTMRDEQDNVDSPAIWHGPNGEHWLIATAKYTDTLLVHNAVDGKLLRRFGEFGSEPGQLDRPNGVFVIDDLLWVVERDNRRVQVLRLPGFESLLSFGADGDLPLRKPYGLWVHRLAADDYRVYVTDSYETADEQIPLPEELDQRVRPYRVQMTGAPKVTAEAAFGDTAGRGMLRIVESIWGDPATGNLMVADEEEYLERNVKVYGLDGKFRGQRMGGGVFHFQAEGLALYTCADGSGWWFATDQGKQENYFHVFERRSLEYFGSFTGTQTLNTDGIWLTQTALPGFAQGAFFAVHDDGNVAAFDLGEVLSALQLKSCAQ